MGTTTNVALGEFEFASTSLDPEDQTLDFAALVAGIFPVAVAPSTSPAKAETDTNISAIDAPPVEVSIPTSAAQNLVHESVPADQSAVESPDFPRESPVTPLPVNEQATNINAESQDVGSDESNDLISRPTETEAWTTPIDNQLATDAGPERTIKTPNAVVNPESAPQPAIRNSTPPAPTDFDDNPTTEELPRRTGKQESTDPEIDVPPAEKASSERPAAERSPAERSSAEWLAARVSHAYRTEGEAWNGGAPRERELTDSIGLDASTSIEVPIAIQTTPVEPSIAKENSFESIRSVEAPAVGDQVVKAIADRIESLDETGRLRFEMQLDPPELGRVVVRVEQSQDGLTAHVTVVDEAVLQIVEHQLPRLEQLLRDSGLRFEQFNLSQEQGHFSRQQQHSQSERPESPLHEPLGAPQFTKAAVRVARGRLDVTA